MALAPSTLDRARGTVRVVLSTGAPVTRAGFVEKLAIGAENVEAGSRIPLLDAHRQSSIRDILGRVSDIRHEPGCVTGLLHVSNPDALDMIERGEIGGVSIGYRVSAWADSKDPTTGGRVRTAIRWELRECSLVPVPADAGAVIRSSRNEAMAEDTITTEPAIITRVDVNRSIRSLVASTGLGTAFADDLTDREASIEEARGAVLDAVVARGATTIRTQRAEVGPSHDDPAVLMTRMAEAMAHRMAPGSVTLSDAARPFAGYGLSDCARTLLMARGEPVARLGREELLTRALHTTSDFPELLTGAGNRVLLPSYQAAASPLKALARQRTATDFRPLSLLRVGEFQDLRPVTEAGEITAMTIGEAKEGYEIKTFAGRFDLTRRAIVNDDIGAFGQFTALMGRAAAVTEANRLVALLTEAGGLGPIMGDGLRLFATGHGNSAPAYVAPSDATLSTGRLAMRMQRGLDGVAPIGAVPRYLVVSAALETEGEKLLTALSAATTGDVSVWSGKLTLLVEPRLEGGWFLVADPATMPTLEIAYLGAAPGPQISSQDGWERLSRSFRVVLDFGCGAIDWRGIYRVPGDGEL
jgi:HK97 family phage prohead protease